MQPRGGLFDGLLCLPGHRRGGRHAKRQVRERVALGLHAGAHFLDLALGGQNPASIRTATANDDMPAARQLAVERGDIQAGGACRAHGRVPRLGDVPAGDHGAQEVGVGAAHAHEVRDRHHALRRGNGWRRGHLTQHHEAAPTGLLLAQQLHAGGRVFVGGHDDVLQQVAEQRLDRAFVPAIHFEIVGHGAALLDVSVGLCQQHASRVGEAGAGGLEFLERPQPPRQARQVVFARPQLLRQHRVLGPGRPPGLASSDARSARVAVEAACTPVDALLGRNPIGGQPLALDPEVGFLDVEPRQAFLDALARRAGAVDRMPQRRRRIDGGKHLAARHLDVAFEPLDVAQRDLVLLVVLGQPVGGLLAVLLGPRGGVTTVGDQRLLRLAPRLQAGQLARRDRRCGRRALRPAAG